MGANQSTEKLRSDVLRLASEDVGAEETAFWESFWAVHVSALDIFALMPPSELRDIVSKRMGNVKLLFQKMGQQLGLLVSGPRTKPMTSDEWSHALNILRIVCRVMPFLFERQELRDAVDKLFWDDPESGDEALGTVLVHSLMKMLFLPPFACQGKANQAFVPGPNARYDCPEDWLWQRGVGVSTTRKSGGVMDQARTEMLKCVLMLCSIPLYEESGALRENRFLRAFTSPECPRTAALHDSLLNVICSYEPMSWLPYTNLVVADHREELVVTSLHTLLVLLEEWEGTAQLGELPVRVHGGSAHGGLSGGSSVFRTLFAAVSAPGDLDFVAHGVLRLLWNPLKVSRLYLPGSRREVFYAKELFVLLWKLLDMNQAFLLHLVHSDELVTGFSVPLVYNMLKARKEDAHVGVVYVATFILLILSGERHYGVAMNVPYTHAVRMDLPVFRGSHLDLLFLALHRCITDGQPRMQNLVESFLTIVCNVSPYLTSSSMAASSKLLHMFEIFSAPKYVLARPRNFRMAELLLEAFNNVIQYQYEGNVNLVYNILRRHKVFDALASLSVPREPAADGAGAAAAGAAAGPGPEADGGAEAGVAGEGIDEGAGDAGALAEGAALAAGEEKEQQMDEEIVHVDQQAAGVNAAVSPAEWKPTKEWLATWHPNIPIQTVLRLLNVLLPLVSDFCERTTPDEASLVKFIQTHTLVGLLPVPHRILIRRYQHNRGTEFWISTFLWGVVFLRNASPPLFYGTRLRLFAVTLTAAEAK